jgi:hypothetical protein
MNPRRLFVASCMSIGTAAKVFAIRGDVAGPMSATPGAALQMAAMLGAIVPLVFAGV